MKEVLDDNKKYNLHKIKFIKFTLIDILKQFNL